MSYAERKKFSRQEEDLLIYAASRWICATCGESVNKHGRPQLAHLIAETKSNYARFGKVIIDHPLNRVPTCSLECNGAQNIGNNPGKCRELLEFIRDADPDLSDYIDEVVERLDLPDYSPEEDLSPSSGFVPWPDAG